MRPFECVAARLNEPTGDGRTLTGVDFDRGWVPLLDHRETPGCTCPGWPVPVGLVIGCTVDGDAVWVAGVTSLPPGEYAVAVDLDPVSWDLRLEVLGTAV